MSEARLLASHCRETVQRAQNSEGEYLIALQDTTTFNYSGHRALSGLGTLQGNVRGLLLHNVMVLNQQGLPLGLLHQAYWTRAGGKDLAAGEKESQKWLQGLARVNQQVADLDKRVVVVADREADIFEYFQAERAANVDLLVRVYEPRPVQVQASGRRCALPDAGHTLQDYGTTQVRIERHNRDVELTLRLQVGRVNVHPPQSWPAATPATSGLALVIATEVGCHDGQTQADCFDAETAVEWLLLTSLPLEHPEDAHQVLRFYALRWRIERLHYTLKSGALQVEKRQFDDIQTLVNALTFYSVVAWQLLALTYGVRDDPDQPAETLLSPAEVQLLRTISARSVQSVREGVLALGKLVGFAPSKKQPLPGVKVLATALERFFFIKLGAQAQAASKPLQD